MSGPVDEMVQWIRSVHPELDDIDPDVDLIETRIIDSLVFAEFLIRVEQLAGRPVDVEAENLDDFRTLRKLDRAFFSGPGGAAR